MKIYLVGGAVRDTLLNLPVKDKDYVVVGSTTEEMLSLGYEKVGQHFPVFLHPQTKEEYALARTETKTGQGYNSFSFNVDNVSLEQDLFRRDLTINAMAMDGDTLIDPYGGKSDLDNKVLKHVSSHFEEDPLRVLRVARFKARYADFSIDPQTFMMMKLLTKNEGKSLVPERVLIEFNKALKEVRADLFLSVLDSLGFFEVYFNHYLNYNYDSKFQELSYEARWAYLLVHNPFLKLINNNSKENSLARKYALLLDSQDKPFSIEESFKLFRGLRLSSEELPLELFELLEGKAKQKAQMLLRLQEEYKKEDLSFLSSIKDKNELKLKLKEVESTVYSRIFLR